jgi:hypothetical protein
LFDELGFAMPGVLGYEIPSFEADLKATIPGTDQPFFDPPLDEKNTAYLIWIGHNDLGNNGFLNAGQTPGYAMSDYLDCVYENFDALYKLGARIFVLGTLLPLELTPLYANEMLNGLESPAIWPEKSELNSTIVANDILSLTNTVNAVFEYRTPYELQLANRYPGAHFALFDGNSFVRHVYHNPQDFFNGSIPANIHVPAAECEFDEFGTLQCELAGDAIGNPDVFMWFDDVHATEQTHPGACSGICQNVERRERICEVLCSLTRVIVLEKASSLSGVPKKNSQKGEQIYLIFLSNLRRLLSGTFPVNRCIGVYMKYHVIHPRPV